jgi:hypothetical protein
MSFQSHSLGVKAEKLNGSGKLRLSRSSERQRRKQARENTILEYVVTGYRVISRLCVVFCWDSERLA